MDHSVDAFFQFNECAIGCHIADFSCDARTNGILLFDSNPGVGFELTNAQRNLLLFLVHAQNNRLDLLSLSQNIRGTRNSLGPREFRNMNQTFNALFDLNKSPVWNQISDFTAHSCSNREALFDAVPRVALGLLEP